MYQATKAGAVKGRDIYDIHACLGAGIILPFNLTAVVGPERFDAVLEALEYDTDRIMGEIHELSQRQFTPGSEDLHRSISEPAASTPSLDFVEHDVALGFEHLDTRLRLRIEKAAAFGSSPR